MKIFATLKIFDCSPQLLARYPHTDHADFPLPRDMVYFCQPDGCVWTHRYRHVTHVTHLTRDTCNKLSRRRRPGVKEKTSFVFTLTDKDSGITRSPRDNKKS